MGSRLKEAKDQDKKSDGDKEAKSEEPKPAGGESKKTP